MWIRSDDEVKMFADKIENEKHEETLLSRNMIFT